jgi:hypothetical protein
MKPICPACARGPSAIDGHDGLRVRTMGPSLMTFTCKDCDSVWSRTVQGTTYSWKMITAAGSGALVPGGSKP